MRWNVGKPSLGVGNGPDREVKMNKKNRILKNTTKARFSLLEGIPKNLPALQRAFLVSKTVSGVGFDWPHLKGVFKKLREELKEFQEALSLRDQKRLREELGDLLFVLTNLSRMLRIDPEKALQRTIGKFIRRFQYIERSLQKKGKSLNQSTLLEMDALWEEAKQKERKRSP